MPLGITQTDTLQTNAVTNINGATGQADGYGTIYILIQNGAGTCTVNVEGYTDSFFTTDQDVDSIAVALMSSNTGGAPVTNTNRVAVSGAVAVAANTSYKYLVLDPAVFIRARISGAAALGAGTRHTGCTVTMYRMPF